MRRYFSLKVVFTLSRITAVGIAMSAIVVMNGCGGSPTTRSATPAETDVADSRSTASDCYVKSHFPFQPSGFPTKPG